MKLWISMLVLLIAVTGLCVWDGIHTYKVFETMEQETSYLYSIISTDNVSDLNLKDNVENLNDYWTKKMDILAISISRKDMQPISDYLQYLASAIINQNQEDAVTYSRLLAYNVVGLKETTKLSHINLL